MSWGAKWPKVIKFYHDYLVILWAMTTCPVIFSAKDHSWNSSMFLSKGLHWDTSVNVLWHLADTRAYIYATGSLLLRGPAVAARGCWELNSWLSSPVFNHQAHTSLHTISI